MTLITFYEMIQNVIETHSSRANYFGIKDKNCYTIALDKEELLQ